MPSEQVLSDDLVVSAAAGDGQALENLFKALTPQVRIMVNARLNPTIAQTQFAEDLLQETLLAIGQSIGTLENRSASGLRTFASTIASRRVADGLRDNERLRRRGVRSLESSIQQGLPAAAPLWAMLSASGASPLTQVGQASLQHRIMVELGALKPEHREALTLAFFDQIETRDIAQRMGISRAAASMLLIRAVKALRRNLTGSSQVVAVGDHDRAI